MTATAAADSSETKSRDIANSQYTSNGNGSGQGGIGQSGAGYGARGDGNRGEGGFRSREGSGRDFNTERPKVGAMEVAVEHNIERAMKVLKRKLIREGLFKELKARRYYEKPSERKKRKHKESLKKSRKEEARARRSSQLL